MKKPSLPERLAVALLSEIASGHYSNKKSFLSRREIMKLWKVSSPTATRSLHILKEWDILSARSRSGQHFQPHYLQTALLHLNKTQLAPLPGQLSWEAKARNLRKQKEESLQRIAVVSICDDVKQPTTGRHQRIPEMALSIPIRIPAQVIFNRANKAGVAVDFYLDDGTPRTGEKIVESLIQSRMQGVILLRRLLASPVAPLAKPLLKAGIPVVAVFDDCEHLKMVSVNFNNVGLGYQAAQVFLNEGHRHLAVIVPEDIEDPNYYRDRFHGAELASNEFNAMYPGDPVTVSLLSISLHRGKVLPLAKALLSKDNPKRVTAILCTAVGLLRALETTISRGNLKIPDDLSVIMCSTTPTLPSKGNLIDIMKLDFEEIGACAFAALQSLCANQFTEKTWLVDSRYEAYGTVSMAG